MIGVMLGTLPGYAIGVFLQPVSAELGISLTQVLGWSFCWSVGVIVAAPLAGFAADRYGAKRVALFGVVALASALAWTAVGIGDLLTWYVSGLLVGAAVAAVGGITFGRIVSVLFDRGLGTALGIMSTGVGLSAVIGPRLMQHIIDSYSWRTAFIAEALIVALGLPLLWLWLRNTRAVIEHRPAPQIGVTLQEASRSGVFWLLVIGTFGYGLCVSGVHVNMVPYLTSQDMSREAAATAVGIFGAATVAGRLLTGLIIDKGPLHASVLIALMLTLEALAFVGLASLGIEALVVILIVFGFAVGAEGDCLVYLVARFFGRRRFSSIFGVIGIVALYLGTGVGPALFSLTREYVASYETTLVIWAGLAVLSALAFLATVRAPFRQ